MQDGYGREGRGGWTSTEAACHWTRRDFAPTGAWSAAPFRSLRPAADAQQTPQQPEGAVLWSIRGCPSAAEIRGLRALAHQTPSSATGGRASGASCASEKVC